MTVKSVLTLRSAISAATYFNHLTSSVHLLGIIGLLTLPTIVQAGTADDVFTKNAPQLNQGRIKGGVRVMTGEAFNLNSGIAIDGTLSIPGTPNFSFGGGCQPPSIVVGTGAIEPAGYRITINNSAAVGGIKTRVDAVPLPQADAPQAGSGTRDVRINKNGDSPGDFSSIQTLTLNHSGEPINLPPGRYERITLNKGSEIKLQAGTAQNPALYEIQRLDVNGSSRVTIDGPVDLRIANSLNLNGYIGNSQHPEWLKLSISGGSFSLNQKSTFHGKLIVPNGTLMLNGESLVHGVVHCRDLVLNGNSIIECEGCGNTQNLPPVATPAEASTAIAQAVVIPLVGSDPENADLTYTIATAPSHGTVTLNGNLATYTPQSSYIGEDSFTFVVSDGVLTSGPASVLIHVFQPNRPPVASSATLLINQGETDAPITLSASDPEGQVITYQLTSQPSHGTLAGVAPALTYTHTGERSTVVIEDSFTYTATDANGAVSAPATITLQLQPVNRAPSANPLSLNTNEDQNLAVTLTGQDPDQDVLTYEIVRNPADETAAAGPSFGTLIGDAPNFTYQPNPNFHGVDRFFYRALDGALASEVVEVVIVVASVNDAPVVEGKSANGLEDNIIELQLAGTDVDGDLLVFTTTLPDGFPGSVNLSGNTLTFTPATNFNGIASLSYTATDPTGASASANIDFTVAAANDSPVATVNPEPYIVVEDGSLDINLTGTDVDGDTLTFEITTQPTHGTLTPNPDGTLRYQPSANYFGADSFAFIAKDASASSSPVTADISVTPVNDTPIAQTAVLMTDEDQALPITLSALDVDGDSLSFTITSAPQHGSIVGTAPNLSYQPNPNYNGTDSFEFSASDAASTSVPAIVSVTVRSVNDAPVSDNLTLNAVEDLPMAIQLVASDTDGDPLAFSVTTPPTQGTLTGTAPNLIYTPAPDFNGEDTFSYLASDSSLSSNIAKVTIRVTAQNDAPTALAAQYSLEEDSSVAILLTSTDPDGEESTFQITSNPLHGTLSGTPPALVYTPNPNYSGTDTFSFVAKDAVSSSTPASITLTITPANDAPTAIAASATITEDTSSFIDLQANDPDGDALSYTITSQPQHGQLSGTAPHLTYAPNANFNGQDSFTFTVNDGQVESAAANVAITVAPVDDAPVATAAIYTLRQHESTSFVLSGTSVDGDPMSHEIRVLPTQGTITGTGPEFTYTPAPAFNGTDSLQFVSISNRSGLVSALGTVTFTVTPNNLPPVAGNLNVTIDGSPVTIVLPTSDPEGLPLTYTVGTEAASYVTISGTPPNLTLTRRLTTAAQTFFTYKVTDDRGLQATGTVNVKILLPNRNPTINSLSLTMDEDASMGFKIIASDPDNDPLSYAIELPAGSPCIIEGQGPEFMVRLSSNFTGITTFNARVTDGRSGFYVRAITLTVLASNDAPVVTLGNTTGMEDSPLSLSITATDPEGSPVSYTLISPPSHGTLAGTLPNVTYIPNPNFNGADTFVFGVSDGSKSVPVNVPIQVTQVNDAPTVSRITDKLAGLTSSFALNGYDPDGDPLSYRLITSPGIGSATITGNLLTFTTSEIYLGNLHFSYVANDGTVDSPPTSIVLTGGIAPEARIVSPIAGARIPMDVPVSVVIDGHDPDGTIIRYDLLANGALVASSTTPTITWTPTQNGPVALAVKVTDDSSFAYTSAALALTVNGDNQAPVVSAGSDRNAFAVQLGPNLIQNGSCELPLDANGKIPFWQFVEGVKELKQTNAQSYNSSPYRGFPAAKEGLYHFGPDLSNLNAPAVTSKLTQTVALDPADPVGTSYQFGAELFFYTRTTYEKNPHLREAWVEMDFLDVDGAVISSRTIKGKLPDYVWYPVRSTLEKPEGATSLRITLHAYTDPLSGGSVLLGSVYCLYDQVTLRKTESIAANTMLVGDVSDDQLPATDNLSFRWTQIQGPNAQIVDPASLTTQVAFSSAGLHVFKLEASDGSLSSDDSVAINVGLSGDENAPPKINLADVMEVTTGSTPHALVATVTDDGKPNGKIYHYWELISGPTNVGFSDFRVASTGLTVSVPGLYILRLTSHDGNLAASREIAVKAVCEPVRQPIDLYICTDHSGSMFGPQPNVVTDEDPRTPIYQARQLVSTLLRHLDPAIDRVSINRNNSYYTGPMPFTADFNVAREGIIMPTGNHYPLTASHGASATLFAISNAIPFIEANGRPGAKKVVLHLNDGFAGAVSYDPELTGLMLRPSVIAQKGITTISISMLNMLKDPMDRIEISNYVTSPAHAFFVESLSDEATVQEFLNMALSPLCRDFTNAPKVRAGEPAFLPTIASIFHPQSYVEDDQPIETLSINWEQIAGPTSAQIDNPHQIRPTIRFTEQGAYQFRLSAMDGKTTSSDTVWVNVGITSTTPTPQGLIAYWPFDGSMRDIVGNRTLAPQYSNMPPVFANESKSGQALDLNGRTYPFRQIDGPLFKLHGSQTGMAVSLWFKTPIGANNGWMYQFAGYSTGANGSPYNALPALSARYMWSDGKRITYSYPTENSDGAGTFYSHPITSDIQENQWNHMVVNYDQSTRKLSVYTNGVLTNSTTYPAGSEPVFARNGQGLCIGPAPSNGGVIDWASAPTQQMFTGIIDELAVFNRTLDNNDISNLIRRTDGLTPPNLNPAPIVDAGPNRVSTLSQPEVLLEGYATDDNPDLNILWSLQSGPADGVVISNPELPQCLATFSKAGIYTFKLAADDGYHQTTDTIEVRIDQPCQSNLLNSAFLWYKANGDMLDAISDRNAHWLGAPQYADSKVGKAFLFNGSNGYIANDQPGTAGLTEITIEGWIRDDSAGTTDQQLFEIATNGALLNDNKSLQVITRAYGGNSLNRYIMVYLPVYNSVGSIQSYTYGAPLANAHRYPLAEFYHLAITASHAKGMTIYVNGQSIFSSSIPSALALPSNPSLRIGKPNAIGSTAKFAVDEFTMYSTALDASDVFSIHQAGASGKCPPWAQVDSNSGFVDAGPSAILAEPASHTFSGSYEPNDFAANPTLSWTSVSGPAPVSLTGADTLTPSAAFTVPGRHVFRLSVTDGTTSGSDLTIVDLMQAANTAPVIALTPPSSLQLPQDTLTFTPTVTDDGLPDGQTTSSWRLVSGPASVSFSLLEETENPHDVSARFTAPGNYAFEFLASDNLLTTTQTFTVTVLPEPTPPSPNTAPLVSLGENLVATSPTVQLAPTITDDGKPNGQISFVWDFEQGPAAPSFSFPAGSNGAEAIINFPLPGTYEIRLAVSDGELSSVDTVLIEVPASVFGPGSGLNAGPVLASIPSQAVALPETNITLQPEFTDADGPATSYAYAWEQIGGPAALAFSNPASHASTITFPEVGNYLVKFTLTDGPFVRSIYIALNHIEATNAAPTLSISPPGGSAQPMSSVTLTAHASDDGPMESLSYSWDWLSAPAGADPVFSSPCSPETQVSFPLAGDYILYCQVSDGQLSTHQTVSFRVSGEATLSILSPQEGNILSDEFTPEAHIRAFRNGGSVSSVTLALDGLSLGQANLEPNTVDYFLQLPPMVHGNHTLTATATFDDGTVLTQTSHFQYSDFAEDALKIEIESPHEFTEDVTAPTPVIGTVKSPQLASYTLEIAPLDQPLAKKTLATGTNQVLSGTIGMIDPTMLENGIYKLTLRGTTTNGLFASVTEQIVISGQMKLGQFSLAFEDLSVDLPGTPLAVTRVYDSRDAKGGDFGPGWSLATRTVKVRKTRPLNEGWEQSLVSGGFVSSWVFAVQPTQRKRVIISFPGGRTETFDVRIRAQLPYSEEMPNAQKYVAVYGAQYDFVPVGSSQGTLEVAGDSEIFWNSSDTDYVNNSPVAGSFTGASEEAWNPIRFRYSEPGGSSYIIDEELGLLSIEDNNGNRVQLNRDGIHHSSGESVVFTRDAAGRITEMTDFSGLKLRYFYDASGRLNRFTNRVGQSNTFEYLLPAFPHYLTSVKDATGIAAVRTTYDSEGRMIAQTDALGKSITFTHAVSQRRESITDRLGNTTIHEFDEFGNVTRTIDALGGVTRRSYDANDNETSTTTPLGFTTSRDFDSKGNLLSEADPLGNVTSYTYDNDKRPLAIIDALNQATLLSYTTNGNLTSMVDPGGTESRFGYDGSGNLAAITDVNGTRTSYTHDAKGREKSMRVTDANGSVLASEVHDYDLAGNRIRSITFDGSRYLTTTFTYDAENRLTRTTYPDGTSTTTSYDPNGKVLATVNAAGYSTSNTYDARGNLTKVTEPGSRITSYGYDVENRQTSTTDTLGNTTYTLYDALGRTTATILPDATMPTVVLTEVAAIAAASELADNPRTLTEYDADGRVIATTDALGNTTTYEYDAAGRRTSTLDALGNRFISTYDASGRQTAMTDAKGSTTTYIYDVTGRLIRTNLPDGTHTSSVYDALGRRVASTDAGGNTTQYAYDPQGRLIAVTDPLGHTTRYGYDLRGLQTSQTDALGRTTRYEYDAMGRRTARILPEGQREEMTYNNLGLMTAHKDFNGYSTARSYALATNFLTSIQAASNHPSTTLSHAPYRFEFSYDLLGRRTTSISRSKAGAILTQETYSYDTQSRLLSYSGPAGGIGYAYDANGNLAGAKSGTPGGYDVSYDYDALGRLSNVYRGQEGNDPNARGLAAYNYDANGNLNGVGYANGVQHAYQYNALNRLTELTVARAAGQSSPAATLQGYGYSLDANGMRTRITEHSGRTIDHIFDKLQRLTKETINGGYIGDPNGSLSYTYDAVGNRTQRNTTGELTALLPDQTQSFTANDRLTSDGYDANGNTTTSQATVRPTQTAGVTDVYSFDNRLIRRTRADGMEIDVIYTPDGNRSLKHVKQGGLTLRQHRYLTDSNNPTGYAQVIEEHDPLAVAGETLRKVHLYGHDLIATESRSVGVSPPPSIFYQYDGLGSVRGISNESGDLTETYDYDAYGNLIGFTKYNATTGSLESHNLSDPLFSYASLGSEYLFTGEQWDADLGMYFLRARYLNTATGTFHTMDTHEGHNGEPLTLHKYLYAHGNPVMGVDPSGMSLLSQVAATIGTLMRNIKSFAISAAYRTKMLFGIARIFITRIGASIQRWLITEIGKNAVSKAVWTEISHLSAYERGLWILRNLKWYQWVNLRALFLQGRTSLDIFAKGPTIGGWVGSGVVVGSLVYFRDEVIEYVKGIIHIAKKPSTLFE